MYANIVTPMTGTRAVDDVVQMPNGSPDAIKIASTLPWMGEGSLIEIAEAKRFLTTVRH